MDFESHAADLADVPLLVDFLMRLRRERGNRTLVHVGDLLWNLFGPSQSQAAIARNLRVWESSGEVVGFGLFPEGGSWFEFTTSPAASPALPEAILLWASEHSRERTAGNGAVGPVVAAFEDDADRRSLFEARGMRPTGQPGFVYMERPLDDALFEPSLPPGFTIRPVREPDDIAERVAIHAEVWHPSRITPENYMITRSAPGYQPGLDLAIVAPDGRLVSYCIAWIDPMNCVAEIEPMGTRPTFRGQGLGRALLHGAFHQMRGYGMRQAIVYSYLGSPAACRLYESAGFRPFARTLDYAHVSS